MAAAHTALLALLFGFFAFVAQTDASITIGNGTHPDYPGQCHVSDEITLNAQERVPYSRCCEVYCHDDSSYQINCCTAFPVPSEDCSYTSTAALAYPDCCAAPVCDD